MRLLGHFKIMNMPLAARIWMALASSFHNFSQAVCEFCDNAISNFCGNADDPSLVRVIRIDVRKRDAYVDVTIEDGGTGIKDLNNAMTLGGMDAWESPMN